MSVSLFERERKAYLDVCSCFVRRFFFSFVVLVLFLVRFLFVFFFVIKGPPPLGSYFGISSVHQSVSLDQPLFSYFELADALSKISLSTGNGSCILSSGIYNSSSHSIEFGKTIFQIESVDFGGEFS